MFALRWERDDVSTNLSAYAFIFGACGALENWSHSWLSQSKMSLPLGSVR